ncbi:DUF2130 domain-containing protein [Opitutales bacterium ASA1]|uniref:DUF2130 domain-containing protein n=1 Tax=Congregicoccus parvus TaxID=3081749 RepID=UPI002B305B60|nr:DUF2130 domain-containing protein [Opitutales bacterium ASA1]
MKTVQNEPIVIDPFEPIRCPKCSHQFALHEGLTEAALTGLREKHSARMRAEAEKMAAVLAEGALKKAETEANAKVAAANERLGNANQAFTKLKEELDRVKQQADVSAKEEAARATAAAKQEIDVLKRNLADKDERLKKTPALLDKVASDARKAATEEAAAQQKVLEDQLAQQKQALEKLRENEIALRKEKAAIETAKAEMAVSVQRKLDEGRAQIREEVAKVEAEKSHQREAELRKKLEDAQRANDELARKLAQGSQQTQGEVAEVAVEQRLREAYPSDVIEPVPNGTRGADVVHKVVSLTGQPAGVIVWESKRAARWQSAWVAKLKRDAQEQNARLAILVTSVMPKDVSGPFGRVDGVFVISEVVFAPFADVARAFVLRYHQLALSRQATQDQMAQLFEYVVNGPFSERLQVIAHSAVKLAEEINRQRNYVQTSWQRQEQHLKSATESLNLMRGEFQALCDAAVAKLASVDEIDALPAASPQAASPSNDEPFDIGGVADDDGPHRETA